MKFRFIIFSFVLFSSFLSCDKKETEPKFPDNFTKKVLLEEFSGEWCANCVEGAKIFETLLNENPERYIGVGIHQGDPFQVLFPNIIDFLMPEFDLAFIPSTIVQRSKEKNKGWSVIANSELKKEADVGIQISTEFNKTNNLDIGIELATKDNLEDLFLTVYIVEDFVPESTPGAQNGGGENYIHRHVLRKILTNKAGESIDLDKEDINTKTYSNITLGQYDKTNTTVVAFVHYGNSKAFKILNVNSVKVGEDSNW